MKILSVKSSQVLLRSAHLTKPAFLFQSVGKLISEGAPPEGGEERVEPTLLPPRESLRRVGTKNTSPRGSLCAVCESLKTHSSEMLAGARLGSATDRGCRRRRHRDIGSSEEIGFSQLGLGVNSVFRARFAQFRKLSPAFSNLSF